MMDDLNAKVLGNESTIVRGLWLSAVFNILLLAGHCSSIKPAITLVSIDRQRTSNQSDRSVHVT